MTSLDAVVPGTEDMILGAVIPDGFDLECHVVEEMATEQGKRALWGAVAAYRVRITANDLNIRKGAGTNYASAGYIKPGVYTIVAESPGEGATKWGKLKSGAGWISLDFAKKM